MKKIKAFLMSLLTLTMSMSFSSCGTDDIVELFQDEYFIVLDEVATNIVNPETGESLASVIYEDFTFDKGGKSQSLGKSDIAPLDAFEKSCEIIRKSLEEVYSANLPEGGWISFTLSLRKDSPNGDVEMTEHIYIQ